MVPGARLVHLTRRFFGSLRPGGPAPADEAWARSLLLPGEAALWGRMTGADRRHAVGVARRAATVLGREASRPVLAAALLHDAGKVDAALGTFGRVLATVAAGAGRRGAPGGRIDRYLRHDVIGAALLAEAGADRLTVTWAAEHHLPPDRWTIDGRVGAALKAADDD